MDYLKTVALFFILFISTELCAQATMPTIERPANSIELGFLNDCSIYSLQYDHFIERKNKLSYSFGGGIGYNEDDKFCLGGCLKHKYTTIPHHISFNYGKKNNFFELGIGGIVGIEKTNSRYINFPFIGFRHQPLRLYRLNYKIFVGYPLDIFNNKNPLYSITLSPIGFSAGFCF